MTPKQVAKFLGDQGEMKEIYTFKELEYRLLTMRYKRLSNHWKDMWLKDVHIVKIDIFDEIHVTVFTVVYWGVTSMIIEDTLTL